MRRRWCCVVVVVVVARRPPRRRPLLRCRPNIGNVALFAPVLVLILWMLASSAQVPLAAEEVGRGRGDAGGVASTRPGRRCDDRSTTTRAMSSQRDQPLWSRWV